MELFAGLREVPNLHMVVVHFPVALLPVSLLCDLLGWWYGSRDLHAAGRWTLWIGTLSAAIAVGTGLMSEDALHPYVTEAAEELMEMHETMQLWTLGGAVVLSLWRFAVRAPFPGLGAILYLILAAGLVVNLLAASDFGGQMVFVHGVSVRADADSLQGGEVKGHGEHGAEGGAH